MSLFNYFSICETYCTLSRDEMQDIVKAQKNVELFFAEEKDSKEKEQTR